LALESGLKAVAVAYAGRGSVVLAEVGLLQEMTMALGLVDLDGKYSLFPGEKGLVMIPTLQCLQAWRPS
jgi:hypothetical protein